MMAAYDDVVYRVASSLAFLHYMKTLAMALAYYTRVLANAVERDVM